MNPDNKPQRQQRASPLMRSLLILASIAALGVFMFSLSGNNSMVEDVALPEIVGAIEEGDVENLTVRGDELVAMTSDGTKLTSLKEPNISAVESLQILGVSPEASGQGNRNSSSRWTSFAARRSSARRDARNRSSISAACLAASSG